MGHMIINHGNWILGGALFSDKYGGYGHTDLLCWDVLFLFGDF